MPGERILIVDDEPEIRELISRHLSRDGMPVAQADCGQAALDMITCEDFALVVLDIMMRGMDGFDVLREIRKTKPDLPVIFLSACQEDYDIVLGFGLGADDYIKKPFSPAELTARVKARIRRGLSPSIARDTDETIVRGTLRLDLKSYALTKRDVKVELSAREVKLLRLLMENPLRVFTKTQIYRNVWEDDFPDDNSVMVYISHIRDKIEDNPKDPQFIQTVRGIGYKFAVQ